MRWNDGRRSQNVDDRSQTPGRLPMRGLSLGGGAGGIGLLLVGLLVCMVLGINPLQFLQQGGGDPGPAPVDSAPHKEMKDFVSVVLADTEDVWKDQFRKMGKTYSEPTLVLFHGSTKSGCGFAEAAVGPFYCPKDTSVYVDLTFFEDLKSKFKAPGDFAVAYVLAHEVGHHVQHLLGLTDKVHAAKDRVPESEYNKLSVRLELQADFLAGYWAQHAQKMRNILEPGDLEEAIKAAEAVGDDRLQRQSKGFVVPDSFTHGSSAQRAKWFMKGFNAKSIQEGDTFSTNDL